MDEYSILEEENAWIENAPILKKPLGETVLIIKNLNKYYKIPGSNEIVRALKNINLSPDSPFYPVRKGEFVILRGPSGGGKTTLLNILGTIDSASSGELKILGERISTESADSYLSNLRLRKIGFVFQTFNLLATMTAFENVELPMTIMGKLSKKERKEKTLRLLRAVGLQDRINHLVSFFSLLYDIISVQFYSRALANDPEILLLDEPTGDLDTLNTIEIMDLLLKINLENKTTCIMVTHNPDVECYGDRLLFIQDGQFYKQVINEVQTPLIYEDYCEYLKAKDKNKEIEGLDDAEV
ncbi:P-loop containing nucleoside triphosphate hydrolase protein [Neocallimastix lanati (nom. inval.)]|nr:P-loop containing nucleoside triphosphate hydrolase protein [Neocallimastix sp. JGI-2020a]